MKINISKTSNFFYDEKYLQNKYIILIDDMS